MGDRPGSLTLVIQPQAFFKELVSEALDLHKVTPKPETEFYLVNLLNQFMTTERLKEEPLALMVKQALEAETMHEQNAMFRQVGDVSLYVAGYFQDSLNRKLVDVDYYIEMGGSAYQRVAAGAPEESLRDVYSELATQFGTFVDVLAEVSDKTTPRGEKDILRLYEMYIRTGSERAFRALQEAGIIPSHTIKKDWQ